MPEPITPVYGLASPHAAAAMRQMAVPLVVMPPMTFVCDGCKESLTMDRDYDGMRVCEPCVMASFGESG